jgi:hypothetical protein
MSNTTDTAHTVPEIIRGGFTIRTRYLPPTDFNGGMVKAWRVDRCRSTGKTEVVRVGFHATSGDAHDHAALTWVKTYGQGLGIAKLLRGRADDDGHTFTVVFE